MINRRRFLTLVRNRVAAGVLCSGMLTDALTRLAVTESRILVASETIEAAKVYLRHIGSEISLWSSQYMMTPDLSIVPRQTLSTTEKLLKEK